MGIKSCDDEKERDLVERMNIELERNGALLSLGRG
jgi:hypothetical protein